MAKYKVKCFYTYCGEVEVEAETMMEAINKGQELCSKITIDNLDYVGYSDTEVEDENGGISYFA